MFSFLGLSTQPSVKVSECTHREREIHGCLCISSFCKPPRNNLIYDSTGVSCTSRLDVLGNGEVSNTLDSAASSPHVSLLKNNKYQDSLQIKLLVIILPTSTSFNLRI